MSKGIQNDGFIFQSGDVFLGNQVIIISDVFKHFENLVCIGSRDSSLVAIYITLFGSGNVVPLVKINIKSGNNVTVNNQIILDADIDVAGFVTCIDSNIGVLGLSCTGNNLVVCVCLNNLRSQLAICQFMLVQMDSDITNSKGVSNRFGRCRQLSQSTADAATDQQNDSQQGCDNFLAAVLLCIHFGFHPFVKI